MVQGSADEPVPGDFVVVHSLNVKRPRFWKYDIPAALIEYGTNSHWNHVACYVGTVPGFDKPQCVEARPGGAGFVNWDSWDDYKWSTGRLPAELTPNDEQRKLIVASWLSRVGTPYGWLDVIACGLVQDRAGAWFSRDNPPWWYQRVASRRNLICSQYADVGYQDGGVHLIKGHWPGLVSPGDLGRLFVN